MTGDDRISSVSSFADWQHKKTARSPTAPLRVRPSTLGMSFFDQRTDSDDDSEWLENGVRKIRENGKWK